MRDDRIREILNEAIDHDTTLLDLMKRGQWTTHDEKNVDTTAKSIADTADRIEKLKEALYRLEGESGLDAVWTPGVG
jgi:hypothetical protein